MGNVFELTTSYKTQLKELFIDGSVNFSGLPKPSNPLEAAIVLISTPGKDVSAQQLDALYNEFCYNREFSHLAARHSSADEELQGLQRFQVGVPGSVKLAVLQRNAKDRHHPLYGSPDPRKKAIYYDTHMPIDPTVDLDKPEVIKIDMWLAVGKPGQQAYFAKADRLDAQTRSKLMQSNTHVRKVMAQRTDLTEDEISELMKDKSTSVKTVMATRPNLAQSHLTQLAKDKDEKVSEVARRHPNFESDAQTPASDLSITDVRSRLKNASTSSESLWPLMQSDQDWVKASLALHNSCTATMLDTLMGESKLVKCYVALSASLTVAQMQQLLDESIEIQRALAQNPAATESTQLKLADIDDETVRIYLANHTCYGSVWDRLLRIAGEKHVSEADIEPGKFYGLMVHLSDPKTKGLTKYMRQEWGNELYQYRLLARHPNITSTMANLFSYYMPDDVASNPKVAMKLLENPSYLKPTQLSDSQLKDKMEHEHPGYIIQYHAQYPDQHLRAVRLCAASKRLSTVNKLAFAMSEDARTKRLLLGQVDLDGVVLGWLTNDSLSSIREQTAQHKKCPSPLLTILAKDKNSKVKSAALSNKNYHADKKEKSSNAGASVVYHNKGKKADRIRIAECSTVPEILADLGLDRQSEVRWRVASNENTPFETLKMLASDQDEQVASSLAWRFEDSESEILSTMFDAGGWPRAKVVRNRISRLRFDHGEDSTELAEYVKPLLALNDLEIDRTIARFCRDTEIVKALSKSDDSRILEALFEDGLLTQETIQSKLSVIDQKLLTKILYKNTWSTKTIDMLLKLDLNRSQLDQVYKHKNITLEQALPQLDYGRIYSLIEHSSIYLMKLADAVINGSMEGKKYLLSALARNSGELKTLILGKVDDDLKIFLEN